MYNEFSPGNHTDNNHNGFSYRLHGAVEIPLMDLPFMIAIDYRTWNFNHNCGFSGDPAMLRHDHRRTGADSVPTFNGRDYDFDGRLGIRIARPRIYLAGAFMSRRNNYGYPIENGAGVGLENFPTSTVRSRSKAACTTSST